MTYQAAYLLIIAFEIIAALVTTQSQSAPSPAYDLQISGLRTAEISPNEKWLAALVTQTPKATTPSVVVQIWDFRNGTFVQNRDLDGPTHVTPGETGYIRYSGDGNLLAVYMGAGVVHVLGADDLKEMRKIQLDSASDEITGFEISPAAHILALRRSTRHGGGDVLIYDLDTGNELRSWKIDRGVVPAGSGVAWRSDGRIFGAVAADNFRCTRFGGTVYLFDPALEKPVSSFRVSFLPGTLAFGTGDRLYVVSSTCGGYFANWAPDLPIFDATTGRQIGKIPGDKVGIRRYITISVDKKRLLAFADREKTTLEGLEDYLKISRSEWQVRDLPTGKLVSTLPGSEGEEYSLSTSGHFAFRFLHNEVRVFSLPTDAN
jgi:WD40 repeat protein